YTWENAAAEVTPEPLEMTYLLDEMPPGRYLVELWDPLTGEVLGEESLRVREDGLLRFDLLPLTRQLALRIFRQPEMPTPTATPLPELPTATPSPEVTVETTPLIDLEIRELGEPRIVTATPREGFSAGSTPEATEESTGEAA